MNLKTAWLWLVRSSENPKKVSLTAKGFLLGLVPVLGILGLDSPALPQGIDLVVAALEQTLIIVSAGITLVGFVRKISLTLQRKNEVLIGLKKGADSGV